MRVYTYMNFTYIAVIVIDYTWKVAGNSYYGMWQPCLGSFYHASTDNHTYRNSQSYCERLLSQSHLANLGTVPLQDVQSITSCRQLNLLNEHKYWLNSASETGLQVRQCKVLKVDGKNIGRFTETCSNLAHPLCVSSTLHATPANLPSQAGLQNKTSVLTITPRSQECKDGTYVLTNESKMNYSQAEQFCKAKYNSGVMLVGDEDESFISKYLQNCIGKLEEKSPYWIGLCRTIHLEGQSIKKEKVDDCTRAGNKMFAFPICALNSGTQAGVTHSIIKTHVTNPWTQASVTHPRMLTKVTSPGIQAGVTHPKMRTKVTNPGIQAGVTHPRVRTNVTNPGIKAGVTHPRIQTKVTNTGIQAGVANSGKPTNVATAQSMTRQGNAHTQKGVTMTRQGNAHTQKGVTMTRQGNAHTQKGVTMTRQGNTHTQKGVTMTRQGNAHTQKGVTMPSTKTTNSIYHRWLNTNASVQYYITMFKIDFEGCGSFCASMAGSCIAENTTEDPARLLGSILEISATYWINISSPVTFGINNRNCSVLLSCPDTKAGCPYAAFRSVSLNCYMKAHCMCEKVTARSTERRQLDIQTIGTQEYHICYIEQNYTASINHCNRTFNATLAIFPHSMWYFDIMDQLNLTSDSFWLGAINSDEDSLENECLTYDGNNKSLSTAHCESERFSVCGRPKDTQENIEKEVLQNGTFMKMLTEMTVNVKDTFKNKRKVSSAKDERKSSRALGTVSAFILCSIVSIVVLMDLPRLRHLCNA